jgi:hypothetical protein
LIPLTNDPKLPPDSNYRITQRSDSYLIWKILPRLRVYV